MIPRYLLKNRVIKFMMVTCLLVIWIVSWLKVVKQLVHVQDNKQKENVHCLSMDFLRECGGLQKLHDFLNEHCWSQKLFKLSSLTELVLLTFDAAHIQIKIDASEYQNEDSFD